MNKILILLSNFLLISISIFLSGCATNHTYTYAGKSYKNLDQAMAAVDVHQRELLDSIKPRVKSIQPKATLVTISLDELKNRIPDSTGNFFVANAYYRDFKNIGEMIRKRNIFSEISFVEGKGDQIELDDQIVVFLHWPSGKSSGWKYKSKDGTLTPVFIDKTAPNTSDAIKHLINSIEALAASEAN
ncbi:hypothetical protein ALISP_1702 [Alicycliphilus sp. B1]|nr:hypothetical protein ALISP_1702 [Alicycliphilus sp. B1]